MGNHDAERVIQRPKGLAVAGLIVPNGREARHSHREAGPQSSAFPVFGALFPPSSRLFSAPTTPAKIAPAMRGTGSNVAAYAALAVAAALLALSACSTIDQVRGNKEGASSEKEAREVASSDPLARPIQVGWTSARATHCGFIFDPAQLRANYMASEAQAGATPEQMQKIERAYDYTRESVLATIKDNLGYCNKERTAAIRNDLNRYLAGDYSPSARMGR
jgi:hypothetical protein